MLLTSGQVSVAISSFVVFLFTSALFLSGYVLQQQTVRDLRAAIKPRPTPEAARMYLPKQFAPQPTPSPREQAEGVNKEPPFLIDAEGMVEVKGSTSDLSGDAENSVTVLLDDTMEGRSQNPKLDEESSGAQTQVSLGVTNQQSDAPDDAPLILDKSKDEKSLSRAERRKKIKEEILAAGEGEGFKGYKRRQW